MHETPSHPYPPLEPAPKGWGLNEALKATVDDAKHYHCGKLEFENKADYLSFRSAQYGIGGTKEQLAALHYIETTGKLPDQQAMQPAPDGTTVDKLLDVSTQKPDAHGDYHLGTLRVNKDEFPKFAELQKDLSAKNPEALAALYHMEHADKPVTFRVTDNTDRNDRFDPGSNTIYWNPNTSVRDAFNKAALPPSTAALHEMTHWAGKDIGDTLQGIPYGKLENAEEGRVIEGTEARDMQKRGLPERHSHYGSVINVKGIDSTTPSLDVKQGDVEREVHAPFQQSGRVISNKDGITTIAVRGDGSQPEHRMEFKTEQLALAMGGDVNQASALLKGAENNKDTVTFQLTGDGRMIYQNPAQEKRMHDHPSPNIQFPQPMEAVNQAPPRQPVGVER